MFLFCIGFLVFFVAACLVWFFHYSRDLPDAFLLAQFAPPTATQAIDPCLKTASVAIPYDSIGDNLRKALSAAEMSENDPGVLKATYRAFMDREHPYRTILSWQISRTIFCRPSRPLQSDIAELRTAAQLERRYSRRDLFTIFANRAYFGENLLGVRDASQHYFRKDPNQLSIAEAALVAGIIRSPSFYSPVRHPDRALQRRNEVIDLIVAYGSVSLAEGEGAKAAGLGVATPTRRVPTRNFLQRPCRAISEAHWTAKIIRFANPSSRFG